MTLPSDKTYGDEIEQDLFATCTRSIYREVLSPLENDSSTQVLKEASSLPLIVQEPCQVTFAGHMYDASREGLYRFWNWGAVRYDHPEGLPQSVAESGYKKSYEGFIRFDGDVKTLLGSLAILHLHGHQHDHLSYEERLTQMRRGALSLVCGDISALAARLLTVLGIRVRIVYLRRLEGRWNTYDNGHVLIEYYCEASKKWVLADIDLHCMFRKDGVNLNFAEMHEITRDGQSFELEPLTPAGELLQDSSEAVLSDFPGSRMLEPVVNDPESRQAWYRRMFASGGFMQNGKLLYSSSDRRRQRMRRWLEDDQIVDWARFCQQFYYSEESCVHDSL